MQKEWIDSQKKCDQLIVDIEKIYLNKTFRLLRSKKIKRNICRHT